MAVITFLSAVPSAGLHWLLRMMQILTAMTLSYLAYRLVKRGMLFVRDVHFLYSLALGSRYLSVAKHKRLRVFTVPTEHLDEVALSEIYNMSSYFVEGETATLDATRKWVRMFDFVFLYRDCLDGTLRGWMLGGQSNREKDGKHFCVMRVGTSLFRKDYTGGPLLYATGLCYCLKQLVLHPRTPLFVLFKVFSYMPYSFCATNFAKCYPRHNLKEIPKFEKSLMDEYGRSLEDANAKYNPETCVLEKETVLLKQFVAPIDEGKQNNPHTKYFLERNPHWQKGHQMVVLTEVTWGALFTIAWRMLKKVSQSGPQGQQRRVRYDSQRSVSSFVTEQEYARRHNAPGTVGTKLHAPLASNNEETGTSLSGSLHSIPEDEQDRSGREIDQHKLRRSQFVKSESIVMGMDRIDDYSQIEIHTP